MFFLFRNFHCLDVVSPRPLSLFATESFLKIYLWLSVVFLFSKNYCLFLNFGNIFHIFIDAKSSLTTLRIDI